MIKRLLQGMGLGVGFAITAPLLAAAWPLAVGVALLVLVISQAGAAMAHHGERAEHQRKLETVTQASEYLGSLRRQELAKVEARNELARYQEKLEELERIYARNE